MQYVPRQAVSPIERALARGKSVLLLGPRQTGKTESPAPAAARHLEVFLSEYPQAKRAFVICRSPRRYALTSKVEAVPWQELPGIMDKE